MMILTSPPDTYSLEEIDEALANVTMPDEYPLCYLCGRTVGPDEEREECYPDRDQFPHWTEAVHSDCYSEYLCYRGGRRSRCPARSPFIELTSQA